MAFLILIFSALTAHAQNFWVEAEAGPVWQGKNEAQIPSDSGTRFSIAALENGAHLAGRVYLGYRLSERHELRALYAPLTIDVSGRPDQPIQFQGQTFSPASNIDARYKFNSYRLTYRYVFLNDDSWTLRVGATAKIRDALIRVSQGSFSAERSNVGFVPLLHFSGAFHVNANIHLNFDIDALAAKQGRAEDVALTVGYRPSELTEFRLGYRTVEGGADGGGDVYNFAWLHYAVLGVQQSF